MASQRSRRVTLPGAADLFFRPTSAAPAAETEPVAPVADPVALAEVEVVPKKRARPVSAAKKKRAAPEPSGRQRHDEKITVYVSAAELLALEQTRLTLRAEHGLSADRGRIVREAVAVLLADFEEHGDASMLVQRLAEN
ncbi:hypothetical protein [Nocardiopsis ansamitocini]|uniref:Cobyrinic acid a,c-diamide synthase n=1 Tax=Nocardiopsis ansamitocini TaxID=1670832 RepID=A0A9W6P2F7_9ACTN|nr:hypothetical protein [Nocardiopsis ansamitocini]GLU45876.1 hypothetical protein Nans01_02270 [Nocardiopsis ansamitocini]